MITPRDEIDPSDMVPAKAPTGFGVALIAGLHVLCCGIPLLLLSGVSLATIFPSAPVIGVILAALGVIGFIWYLRKGCATCPGPERCRDQASKLNPDRGA